MANKKTQAKKVTAVPPKKRSKGKTVEVVAKAPKAAKAARGPVQPGERDPRLPPVGSVLKRSFKTTEYEVTVLDSGFEFQGKNYKSLSKIAREIAGTSWNGFGFFGLLAKPEKTEKTQSAAEPTVQP
jgi:hypothetical protein